MRENVIYFAHGKESCPWGTKIQSLSKIGQKMGFDVESPDYSSMEDPDDRVRKLLEMNPQARKHLVLVGSSMGGYVSAVASQTLSVSGLFLMAPAFYIKDFSQQCPNPSARHTCITHGWHDDVVPVEHSIRYAKKFQVNLCILNSDHRLVGVLDDIEGIFQNFLSKVLTLK